MKNLSWVQKSVYSALVFFGTLMILSVGYAAYSAMSPVTTGQSLTTGLWNTMVANITDHESRISAGVVPTGAVMSFNLTTCPTGWSAMVSAQGRYIVGLPSSGTLAGTAGTALSNLENRAIGQHTHGVTDPGHGHYVGTSDSGGNNYLTAYVQRAMGYASTTSFLMDGYGTDSRTTGVSVNSTGSVSGTNAPYIQLLICQKN